MPGYARRCSSIQGKAEPSGEEPEELSILDIIYVVWVEPLDVGGSVADSGPRETLNSAATYFKKPCWKPNLVSTEAIVCCRRLGSCVFWTCYRLF